MKDLEEQLKKYIKHNYCKVYKTGDGIEYRWCSFRGCGMAVFDGTYICPFHKGKKEKPLRTKGVEFSGDSQWRVKMGQWQAKEGR